MPVRSSFVFLTLVLLIAFAGSTLRAEPVFMPRTPALSPDGNRIAFSFQGDLWLVSASGGEAKRITVHPGYEFHPVWSPDGSMLAFASDRYGSFDIFVMPSNGGTPERLTFAQPTDIPQEWSNDGNTVYFASRGQFDYPMDYQIYRVPVSGGTPFRIVDCFAEEYALSQDGKFSIFAIGNNWFGRKKYRGSYQSDLYLWDQTGDPVPITTHTGYDSDPMISPDGNTIYFRSDSTGTFNLWKMNRDGSGKTQLTFFDDDGIRNARIARNGNRIAMEADSSLYLFELADAKLQRVDVTVASDQIENPIQYKRYSGDADGLAVTSDGSEYALTIRGEIAVVNREVGGRASLPVPDPARDWQANWKPGVSDSLVFTTDRWGRQQIAMILSDSSTRPLRKAKHPKLIRLTNDTNECHHPLWSPLGDRIAYIRGNGELRSMKPDGSDDKLVFAGWNEEQYAWSPDGKWIAFAHEDYDYNSDIWIIPSDGSAPPVNISQHPDEDVNPTWSQDGKMLAWSSRRHHNQFDVYFVYLQRSDDERSQEEWKEWEKTRDKKNGDKGDTTKNGKEKDKDRHKKKTEIDTVKIDFTDIHLRTRRISDLPGDEYVVAIHPKGDKFYFTAELKEKRDLFSLNRFGDDLKAITEGGANPQSIAMDKEGKTFYFLKNGSPSSVGADGGKSEGTSFQAQLKIDLPRERLQVIDEGWRFLGEKFYDPKMHGADWAKLRGKYRRYASQVYHDRDFEDVCEAMLGELNASHMGFNSPGKDRVDKTSTTGELGIEFDQSYTEAEGLQVKSVLPYGPCDKESARILPGDILLLIDGIAISRTQNVSQPLEGKAGTPVLLNIRRGSESKEFMVTPIEWFPLRQLSYKQMERTNRAIVDSLTKKQVGYIHIQGMDQGSLELFERDLYAACNGRDALIIDVRNNGGGSTADLLLTILTQPQHAYTIGRGGAIGYPQDRLPLYRWTKPVAVLCNEASYSNAEIFSHAIQTIKRGVVVGNRTAGGVISTSGWSTVNGGFFRLPLRGWYTYGTKQNQENNGCIPDYLIPLTPGDRMKKNDPQLAKAANLMLDAASRVPSPTGEKR